MTSLLDAPLVGTQEPRLSSVPSAPESSGSEAIRLAGAAGLVLDPWQRTVLEGGLGERPDGQWVCRDVGLIVPRQNGKGAVLEALELAALFLPGWDGSERPLILHTAHEMKTAKNHYERMQRLIKGAPFLASQVKQWRNSNEEISIELWSGAKLRFIARSTGSGRGFSAHRLILDEAMILSPETMGALLPTLSVAPNPQVWYAGSAGLETSEQLARLRDRGLKGADPGLAYFEWSAEDNADLDDHRAWARSNPALGHVRPDGSGLQLEAVYSERVTLPEVQFARERLGIWAQVGGDAVIPKDAWAAVADPGSMLTEPAYLALDVEPHQQTASIAAASIRPDGLCHVELLENRAGGTWVAERIANLCRDRNIMGVVIDPRSEAKPMTTPAMLEALKARNVPLVEVSLQQYAQACGSFYGAVEAKTLRHRGQLHLDAAVDSGRRRSVGDASWAWHRRNAKSDITPLVAVTLALYGASLPTKPQPFVPRRIR